MVLGKIKEMLMEFKDFNPDELGLGTTFASLGLDSLDVVDLIMKIDDEFGTSIQLDENLKTLGDLVKIIENK